jgi:hypothetical protein
MTKDPAEAKLYYARQVQDEDEEGPYSMWEIFKASGESTHERFDQPDDAFHRADELAECDKVRARLISMVQDCTDLRLLKALIRKYETPSW